MTEYPEYGYDLDPADSNHKQSKNNTLYHHSSFSGTKSQPSDPSVKLIAISLANNCPLKTDYYFSDN